MRNSLKRTALFIGVENTLQSGEAKWQVLPAAAIDATDPYAEESATVEQTHQSRYPS